MALCLPSRGVVGWGGGGGTRGVTDLSSDERQKLLEHLAGGVEGSTGLPSAEGQIPFQHLVAWSPTLPFLSSFCFISKHYSISFN